MLLRSDPAFRGIAAQYMQLAALSQCPSTVVCPGSHGTDAFDEEAVVTTSCVPCRWTIGMANNAETTRSSAANMAKGFDAMFIRCLAQLASFRSFYSGTCPVIGPCVQSILLEMAKE